MGKTKIVENFSVLQKDISEEMIYSIDGQLNKGTLSLMKNSKSINCPVEIIIKSRTGDTIHLSDLTAIEGLKEALDRALISIYRGVK